MPMTLKELAVRLTELLGTQIETTATNVTDLRVKDHQGWRVVTLATEEGYAFTLGMQKFALPEFEIEVPPGEEPLGGEFLLGLCQGVLVNGPIEPGVKVVRRAARLEHHDRQGAQVGVERARDALGWRPPAEIEVDDLPARMDTGIGPARRHRLDGLTAERTDRALQLRLDRAPIRLALPADEAATVIFEEQPVAGHDGSSEPVARS